MKRIVSIDIGEKNFAYCVATSDDAARITIEKVERHDVLQKKNQTIAQSCATLSSILGGLVDCDVVLIEQQVRANVRAQRVAQHVWSFFHTINAYVKGGKMEIAFVPAHAKTQKLLGKNSLSGPQRKKWAVDMVLGDGVDVPEGIKALIREMGKKDDVCDSILQLFAFYA